MLRLERLYYKYEPPHNYFVLFFYLYSVDERWRCRRFLFLFFFWESQFYSLLLSARAFNRWKGSHTCDYNQHQSLYNIRNCIFVLFFSFRHSVCIDMFHVRKNNWNFSSFWLHLSNARKGKGKTKRICWRHYPTMCSAGSYLLPPPPPLNPVDVWNVYRKRQKTVEKGQMLKTIITNTWELKSRRLDISSLSFGYIVVYYSGWRHVYWLARTGRWGVKGKGRRRAVPMFLGCCLALIGVHVKVFKGYTPSGVCVKTRHANSETFWPVFKRDFSSFQSCLLFQHFCVCLFVDSCFPPFQLLIFGANSSILEVRMIDDYNILICLFCVFFFHRWVPH